MNKGVYTDGVDDWVSLGKQMYICSYRHVLGQDTVM